MKYFIISWKSKKGEVTTGTDLVKTELNSLDFMKYYLVEQSSIEVVSVKRADSEHFSELTKTDDGKFLLDGVE